MYSRGAIGRLVPILDGPQVTRRQDLPPVVVPNGAVYVADAAWLLRAGSFVSPETVGFIMPAKRSVDLDDELDWMLAELLLAERITS
jgi:CMP-N-acetylneuraminic acid synthetase